MADLKLPLAVLAATVLSGTASLAHAQSASRPQAAFTDSGAPARDDAYKLDHSQPAKVIELDGKSHWGLKLELQQPVTRQMQLKDVEAGAFYKVTPSIRVGGAVGLADTKPPAAGTDANGPEAVRARLGASVKF